MGTVLVASRGVRTRGIELPHTILRASGSQKAFHSAVFRALCRM